MREDNKIPVNSGSKEPSKVVHNVHILDASGSMSGGKYTNALNGINKELEDIKKDSDGNLITQTFIEFTGGGWNSRWGSKGNTNAVLEGNTATHYFMVPAANCSAVVGMGCPGGTPLYQTVGETIEKLMKHINPGEKVIMTIFTDGEELHSTGIYKNAETLKKLIKQVEDHHNFTVTYMGTEQDVHTIIDALGVSASNTFMHMNTASSVGASYATRGASLKSYSKSVARGASQEELKQNFFSKTVTKLGKEEEENKTQP